MTSVLASFRLPLPLDVLGAVSALTERAYGTGLTMMQADGETIHILEPAEGLGERSRKRQSKVFAAEQDDMLATYFKIRDGAVKLDIESEQNSVLLVSETLHQWFVAQEGVNFVEVTLTYGGAEDPHRDRPQYIFTMQRADLLSPAQKLADAEARAGKAEARLAAIADYMGTAVEADSFHISGYETRWDSLRDGYGDDIVDTLRPLVAGMPD